METLRIRDLNFRYPLSDKKALQDISMDVDTSDFIVVCGKSGCGKSTLLRHMKKNMMPYGELAGEIYYRGKPLAELSDRMSAAETGFVQQDPDNQIVTDKVWHELAFGLESLGTDNKTIKRRVAETASFFGIQTWFRRETALLSGGQKQMVNLASVMVMQPKLLILDEPTAQLDPIAASEFLKTVYRINREIGTAVVMSEHRLEEAFTMADKVAVMDEGRMIFCDTPEKAGIFLSKEPRNDMFYGLPSVMKIFAETEEQGNAPLTMREGRIWLEGFLKKRMTGRAEENEDAEDREEHVNAEDIAVKIRGLRYRYDKGSHDILQDTDLEVRKGEWFSIMGGNGTGKTTLLKAVGGLIRPQRGNIEAAGKIAMLPQNPQALFTEITAEEELLEALYYTKASDSEKAEKIEKTLELMELRHLRKTHPYDLSGGEQQRLALGKIFLIDPEIILLDEPTKGLDAFFKRTLAGIFRTLTSRGITIVMVSHDMEFCAENSDRCAMFFDGEVISADRPEEFFSGNNFYTTVSNRMAREWFPKAVTYQEVVECIKKAI